jgi:hypothetical protein
MSDSVRTNVNLFRFLLTGLVVVLFVLASLRVGYAQSLGWEGPTGIFVTPLAYTAASPEKGIGLPIVAYHYVNGGNVLGDFHQLSITAGALKRVEFGYTRTIHNSGDNTSFSPLWTEGFNTFHGKLNVIPENYAKQKWLPAISAGFLVRTQVKNVGGVLNSKDTTNADLYLVATKTVTQIKPIPIVLSAGVRGTNASLFGLGGNAPDFVARSFGAVAFVFKGPAKSTLILGSEVSQQPRRIEGLPLADVPTTLTYAARIVPLAKKKLNVDFGILQAAGQIEPGVNLNARARFAFGISYGL